MVLVDDPLQHAVSRVWGWLRQSKTVQSEAVADARSAYSLYKLLFLTPATMGRMVQLRAAAKAAMDPAIPLLPDGVSDHLHKPADEVRPLSTLDYYFPWWAARLVMLVARRPKKDWNEVLRLSDVPTMDYVR